MEYLYKVLGIKATVQRAEFDHLPNYIACLLYTSGHFLGIDDLRCIHRC